MKVLVIAALEEELTPFLESFENWEQKKNPSGDFYFFTKKNIKNKVVEIYASSAPKYSKVASATHVTRMMYMVNPSIAIMIGICAGDETKVSLGDLVISEKVYDYETGKMKQKILVPEIQSHELLPPLMALVKLGKNKYKSDLNTLLSVSFDVHLASFACGSAVVEKNDIFQILQSKHDRKTLALDMESFAFFEAIKGYSHRCYAIVCKGVCDFANTKKDDSYHEIAAYRTAQWAKYFIEDELERLEIKTETSLFDNNLTYPIKLARPAYTLDDRELWRKVIGWDKEYEEHFINSSSNDLEGESDSGLTFYNLGENKYLLEVSLGMYAYQSGYLYVYLDESLVQPKWEILKLRGFTFDENDQVSCEYYEETVAGWASFDVNNRILSIYRKFRGIGDGYSANYHIDAYGKANLINSTLCSLPPGDGEEFIENEIDITKQYPLFES